MNFHLMPTLSMAEVKKKCPLEERKFERVDPTTGLTETLPSLDRRWLTELNFLQYTPPVFLHSEGGRRVSRNLDPVWVEAMKLLDGDLQWLLKLDYHRFWSQVMYDESLHQFLESYLALAPRPRLWEVRGSQLPLEVGELVRSVNRRVFMVFVRMATHKESPTNFMSEETFKELIYEHYLFDVPKLLDLCALYGSGNGPLLKKMVANVFEKQPRYLEDWKGMVDVVMATLSEQYLAVQGGKRAVRLDRSSSLSHADFSKAVLFLADFSASLRNFLEIYPSACSSLAAESFITKVVGFYETAVMTLQEHWKRLKSGLENQQCIKTCLRSLKCDLAWLVHQLLHVCYISPKEKDSSGVRAKNSLDDFISAVSDIASEKNFLKEYKKQFNLEEDVKVVQQAHPEVSETHFDYVLSALVDAEASKPASKPDLPASKPDLPAPQNPNPSAQPPAMDGVMQSLISHVKDILPHLGEGFIEICLREFDNNPETVVGRILEENLPPHIQTLDFSLSSSAMSSAPPNAPLASSGVGNETSWPNLDSRESVYDNDEFDVFRRPGAVDLSRVHIGKRLDSGGVAQVLDDKAHVQETRERYRAYEIETPWDYISEQKAGELEARGDVDVALCGRDELDLLYDDEYDDTYDSHNVGAADDATDEVFTVRRLNQKGLYGRRGGGGARGDNEEEEEEEVKVGSLQGSSVSNERAQAREFVRNYFKGDKTGGKNSNTSTVAGGRSRDIDVRSKDGRKYTGTLDTEGRRGDADFSVVGGREAWQPKGQGQWNSHSHPKGRGKHENRNFRGDKPSTERYRGRGGGPSATGRDSVTASNFEGMETSRLHAAEASEHSEPTRTDKLHDSSSQTGSRDKPDARPPPKATSGPSHNEKRARQVKDKNKSSRANHNRKAMADKKRRGGMM